MHDEGSVPARGAFVPLVRLTSVGLATGAAALVIGGVLVLAVLASTVLLAWHGTLSGAVAGGIITTIITLAAGLLVAKGASSIATSHAQTLADLHERTVALLAEKLK